MKTSAKFPKLAALPKRVAQSTKSVIGRFRRNEDGVAAVEFAVLSPVMIALYFGVVEIAMIIHADKITSHATNVAGDLATQVSNMDVDNIEDVLEATLATMSLKADQVAGVRVEILSYRMLPNGTIVELGSARLNGGYEGADFNPQDIGSRLLTPTSGAVVARVQYNYESVTYKFVEAFTLLEETFILKPRSSADIPFSLDDTPNSYDCTSSGTLTVNCA